MLYARRVRLYANDESKSVMRKTKTVIIDSDDRDKGKAFFLTEMPSRQAESWADRAFLALAHSSIDLPQGMERSGMAGISQVLKLLQDTQLPDAGPLMNEMVSALKIANVTTTARLISHIKFPELQPLMDEIMECVQFIWDRPKNLMRPLIDNGTPEDDIEEVSTRQYLRSEVLGLHVNFLLAAVILNSIAAASEMREMPSSEITLTSDPL